MAEKQKTINYKIVIVGRSSVGKSCLLVRFTDDRFIEDYLTTIGVDFKFRTLKINNESFKLQIWDTAGQEKYQTITKTFYKGAHAIVVVYDLTSQASYEEMKNVWLEEARKNCDPKTVIMIVGNKMDLEDKIEVNYEEAEQFAQKEGLLCAKASAKTGQNVEQSFFKLTEHIHSQTQKHEEELEKGHQLGATAPKETQNGCCQ